MSSRSEHPEASTPSGQRPNQASQLELSRAVTVMSRWAMFMGSLSSLIVIGLGFWVGGLAGMLGAAVSAGLVLGFFVLGHVIESVTMQRADGFGLAAQVISFVVRIVIFAALLWAVANWGLDDGTLSRTWLAVGAVTGLLAWQAGLILGDSKAKLPTIIKDH